MILEIDQAIILERTQNWLQTVVCDLNLCPFARPIMESGSLRLVVSQGTKTQEKDQLFRDFLAELDFFQKSSEAEIATCLMIFPVGLECFEGFLDFFAEAQILMENIGISEEIQLASFHPNYLFGGEPADDVSHFTNRSPYPMLHFIRQAMLSREIENISDTEEIPRRNIVRLRTMGMSKIQRLLSSI